MLAGSSGPPPGITATGYLHPGYAASLFELGTARLLPASQAWILERRIPGSTEFDAMGCYPLLCCRDWTGLAEDLRWLEASTELVAFSAVIDPFCGLNTTRLEECFPDLAVRYKEHFVVDLRVPIGSMLDAHHRRNVRKGLANVAVEWVDRGDDCDDDFVRLYGVLSAKHGISGWAAFSEESLHQQLRVPGMVAFQARQGEVTVGMTIWYVQGATGYYHLGAYADEGYEARASYAIFSVAIRHFATAGLRWLDLGAAPGLREEQSDGLARFKRGWSTGTRTAYLCGRVLKRHTYAALVEASGKNGTEYFPAYREA